MVIEDKIWDQLNLVQQMQLAELLRNDFFSFLAEYNLDNLTSQIIALNPDFPDFLVQYKTLQIQHRSWLTMKQFINSLDQKLNAAQQGNGE